MKHQEVHCAIRSYKRAGLVKTLEVMPWATIWVPESQYDDYKKLYPNVVAIPDNEDGSCPKKFNAILNRAPSRWMLILDDDISWIGRWNKGTRKKLTPDELASFIAEGFTLASELGVRFWGINPMEDELGFAAYTPYSRLAPILGPFGGHLDPSLRYDEASGVKEDYDFFLQNVERHRGCLRFNAYHYCHAHNAGKGGLEGIRSQKKEEQSVEWLIRKWGSRHVKPFGTTGGKNATGKNILNCRIRTLLPGI